MIYGKLFHGSKHCVNTTWQSILLFQVMYVEVVFDFNENLNATW
jgi:hypothetical protein